MSAGPRPEIAARRRRIEELRREGMSIVDISGQVGLGVESVRHHLRVAGMSHSDSTKAEQRDAVARRQRIVFMGSQGYRPEAIATEVGVVVGHVRKILKEEGIDTVREKIGGSHRLLVNDVMERLITSMEPPEEVLGIINADWEGLDRERFADWSARLMRVSGACQRLHHKLAKGAPK